MAHRLTRVRKKGLAKKGHCLEDYLTANNIIKIKKL